MKIILVSHEDLAEQMLKTAEMFLGKLENAASAGLFLGDSPEDYEDLLSGLINEDEQVLFLCDIKSGTPFNTACKIAFSSPNIRVLYGMNLAMVLECFSRHSEMDADVLANHVVEIMPKTYGAFDL